jgi:putative redox protein
MQRGIAGDLTEEHRVRLLELASKCPIHRILDSQVSISTRLS